MIGVGSPVGAKGGGDHRPDPAPFLADDGTPSPPADDQHSWQWRAQNGRGKGDRNRGSATAIAPLPPTALICHCSLFCGVSVHASSMQATAAVKQQAID